MKFLRKLQAVLGIGTPITRQEQRDKFRRKLKRTGRTIDFTVRKWGHNISGGAAWCTPVMKEGDVILTELGRFICYNVKPCDDPRDMAFFSCIAESDSRELGKGDGE